MTYPNTYYVPKSTGTYADVLVTYGLAQVLYQVVLAGIGPAVEQRIDIADEGPYYSVRLQRPIREEWLQACRFFDSPPWWVITGAEQRKGTERPDGIAVLSVDETWQEIRAYREKRSNLWEEGLRGTELEQALQEEAPRDESSVAVFLGDTRMQAAGICNRIVGKWALVQDKVPEVLRAVLELYAEPEPDQHLRARRWAQQARALGLEPFETASQLLNPHQGKGQNEPKSNALRMGNIDDRIWAEEYLKVVGLWLCLAPRQVADTKDWKAYVLAPLNLSLGDHRVAFSRFNRNLRNERVGDQTSLKSDVTSLLLFNRTWLDYIEATHRDEADAYMDFAALAPERVVAGFHVVQFKLLSRNAYTMVNQSFLGTPAWGADLKSRADVLALTAVVREHLDVARGIDETHSDGYSLLRLYRNFVAGGSWEAFLEFAAGYSDEIMRRLDSGQRWVPTFSESGLRRLVMASNKPLLPIVEDEGFRNIAYAIRHSTVVPQRRKARGQDNLYDVRYGLGAELKRKSTVRDEFVVALADFVHSYNQENAQTYEHTKQQMRRNVRTDDLEQVVGLIDHYGAEAVGNLLVAFGYASEPREDSDASEAANQSGSNETN